MYFMKDYGLVQCYSAQRCYNQVLAFKKSSLVYAYSSRIHHADQAFVKANTCKSSMIAIFWKKIKQALERFIHITDHILVLHASCLD